MRNHSGFTVLTTLAGGLLAAAFLPMAVAFADEYDFTPDTSTFVPTQLDGLPPLYDVVTGSESWNVSDLTTGKVFNADIFGVGNDTRTTIGSFTNDEYLFNEHLATVGLGVLGNPVSFDVSSPSEFDLANFGGGFENAWIDISGPDAGVSDLLITPFGDIPLFGTGFAELAAALS